jgi:2-keto-4-pentenoate hydratase/2-oxohepta-3-ene-1,7-dioic acid hydratase in catechol pathway
MRIVRFEIPGKSGVRAGLETDGLVRELAGDIFGPYDETKGEFPLDDVRLLAPCSPTKITAVGLNYRDHAEEMKLDIPEEPLLFMKPSSSIIGPGDTVRMPSASKRVDYEAELGVVIGRTAYKDPSRKRMGLYSGIHLSQRCHGARPSGKRRSMDAW